MRIPSPAMSPMAVSESGDQASRFFPLAGIRRIAPSCSPILKQLGLICKREATQRGLTKRLGGPTPRRAPKNVAFPLIKAHLSRKSGSNAR
jgi:hypothetical protein